MSKRNNREEQIHKAVTDYIAYQYPQVWYKTDLSGVNQEGYKAREVHKLTKRRGFPDLVIFANKINMGSLYIELKTEGEELILSRSSSINTVGAWKYEHFKEQADWIEHLNTISGNVATFAIGTDHAIKIIDAYMNSAMKTFYGLLIRNQTDVLNYNYRQNPTKWKTAFSNILPEQYRMMQRGF